MTKELIEWYKLNKRELPFREIRNPYFIWISEIILQQTRVNQGLEYYNRFIERFPDIISLAEAEEQEVLKIWQGLGYYSRARNLHFSAKYIINELKGVFPNTFESILKLKGVGNYSAAAIASLAFDVPVPAVDGNVRRVCSRFFGIELPLNRKVGEKAIFEAAKEFILPKDPGLSNQALIELGAMVCKPGKPNCTECPLMDGCFAYSRQMTHYFPVIEKKIQIRHRYFYYFITDYKGKIEMIKRSSGDIWQGLFEFPLLEYSTDKNALDVIEEYKKINHQTFTVVQISTMINHKLSHQHIHTRFIYLNFDKENCLNVPAESVVGTVKELKNLPVSKLIENYLDKLLYNY